MKGRHMNLLSYALNCIYRYKVRTVVILVCLVTSAAVFSSVAFLKDGLVKEGELSLKYAPDITVQQIWAGRPTLIETSYVGYIQEMAGTISVIPRIWGYANVGNILLVIMGIDIDNMFFDPKETFPMEEGSFLSPETPNSVVLGKAVADILGVRVGNTLTILTESVTPIQYQVVGIFNSEANIYNADMILMNIDDARLFFEIPENLATDIAVYVWDPQLVNNVARDIGELQNLRVVTKDIILKAQETTYGARSGFFSVLWYIVLISVAITAFNQTVVVGHESKFEVGLLKALGFSTSDIIEIRLMESAILGVIAGSFGITFGIIYDRVFNAPIFRDFMLGWVTLYPNFTLPIHISASTIFLIYVITILPLLFATVIPSWINATVDPDIAMRGARA